ncbi:MAG: type II toxin-antitoxin system RelE/ParE family toxin [Actinobacteria bacterium]|nr:type II toxin-antitoxin system RelE/ParE family toxin [Actinomycetota bacterium]
MSFLLKYHKAVKDDLNNLEVLSKARIKRAIETRLAIDPIKSGELLKGDLKGFRKLRIGDYRIVYKVIEEEVLILGIRHRKDIYMVAKNREN